MKTLAAMAWRNVLRHPWRSALTALAMGIGVLISMMVVSSCFCISIFVIVSMMVSIMMVLIISLISSKNCLWLMIL